MLFVSKGYRSRNSERSERELKRLRILLGLLVALALALSLVMVVPVYAADVGLTKGVTPPNPNVYNLTDTIHYVMMIINRSTTEDIVVEAVWDVLPDGTTEYLHTGPPYTLTPGQNQTYTYDWEATRTGTVINTFHASGYQISTGGNDTFDEQVTKSSLVIGQEVGGTASLVSKVRLVAPWAGLLACAGIVALFMLRRRRKA
jgi:hypothetical protein